MAPFYTESLNMLLNVTRTVSLHLVKLIILLFFLEFFLTQFLIKI